MKYSQSCDTCKCNHYVMDMFYIAKFVQIFFIISFEHERNYLANCLSLDELIRKSSGLMKRFHLSTRIQECTCYFK